MIKSVLCVQKVRYFAIVVDKTVWFDEFAKAHCSCRYFGVIRFAKAVFSWQP